MLFLWTGFYIIGNFLPNLLIEFFKGFDKIFSSTIIRDIYRSLMKMRSCLRLTSLRGVVAESSELFLY